MKPTKIKFHTILTIYVVNVFKPTFSPMFKPDLSVRIAKLYAYSIR